MSADNYYLIRRDRQGYFVPVMGFVSDDESPIVRERHQRFEEILDALQYAQEDYTEYGVQIAPECYDELPPVLKFVDETDHYYGCSQASTDEWVKENYPECICAKISSEWEKEYLPVDVG